MFGAGHVLSSPAAVSPADSASGARRTDFGDFVRLDWCFVADIFGSKPRTPDGILHHGENYVGQHDLLDLASDRDALGHLSVDQGLEVVALEHDAQWSRIGDSILIGLVNERADQAKQLGVLRSASIPHQEVANLKTGRSTP
jgi:hypothetical protein